MRSTRTARRLLPGAPAICDRRFCPSKSRPGRRARRRRGSSAQRRADRRRSSRRRDRRPDGLLPVAIANFKIAVPHADIRTRVEAAAAAGLALDPVPGPLSNHIEERRVFCATGLLNEQWGRQESAYCGRSVTYLLDSEFYFTNAGTPPPDQVEIDPGDGEGFGSCSDERCDTERLCAEQTLGWSRQ